MKRRECCVAIAALLALPRLARAQKKIARIAMLATGTWSSNPELVDAVRQRLKELGWTEGRDIEFRLVGADGYVERLDALAQQLVADKVDVIIAGPPTSAVAARKATQKIPIVMANVPDPVALALAASLARPGGNVTGVSSQTTVLVAKELELIREILPGAKRIGLLYNEKNPAASVFIDTATKAAPSFGMTLVLSTANKPDELAAAIQKLVKDKAQAVAVPADPMMLVSRGVINELLAKARLPAVFGNRDHPLEGALASYAPDIRENFRMAAGYVDRILRGADPATLPIEQSSKIELILNLRTAKALGITVPRALLMRADRVIE
jgi:putative tryptophan/tyrosine transport system substrate-binding protein